MEPFTAELRKARFWILLGVGLLCLFISTVVSLSTQIHAEHLSESEQIQRLTAVWYANVQVWIEISREIGFASLIALLIFILVDRASKLEQRRSADSLMTRVAQNMLEAAYGVQTSPSIVKHVISEILTAPMIRKNMIQLYTIQSLPNSYSSYSDNYIVLEISSSYQLVNVSAGSVEWPIQIYLPRPRLRALDSLVAVTSCSIGGKVLSEEEIRQGQGVEQPSERHYIWNQQIEKDGLCRVDLSYRVVKEISDNEIWTSLLTTEGLDVVIDNRIPEIYWSFTPRTTSKIVQIGGDRQEPWRDCRITFRATDPLLAFQALTIWWRPVGSSQV
jgi:hypothetical protein